MDYPRGASHLRNGKSQLNLQPVEQHFRTIACKELKIRKKQFDKLEKDAQAILENARNSGGRK